MTDLSNYDFKFLLEKIVVVVVYMSTGLWSVSESLGGDVPALDSDPSVPRIRC